MHGRSRRGSVVRAVIGVAAGEGVALPEDLPAAGEVFQRACTPERQTEHGGGDEEIWPLKGV